MRGLHGDIESARQALSAVTPALVLPAASDDAGPLRPTQPAAVIDTAVVDGASGTAATLQPPRVQRTSPTGTGASTSLTSAVSHADGPHETDHTSDTTMSEADASQSAAASRGALTPAPRPLTGEISSLPTPQHARKAPRPPSSVVDTPTVHGESVGGRPRPTVKGTARPRATSVVLPWAKKP